MDQAFDGWLRRHLADCVDQALRKIGGVDALTVADKRRFDVELEIALREEFNLEIVGEDPCSLCPWEGGDAEPREADRADLEALADLWRECEAHQGPELRGCPIWGAIMTRAERAVERLDLKR